MNGPNSSTTEDAGRCPICGKEPLCGGLGVIRYDVPVDDPNFGKLHRCPNNRPETDSAWQDRLRSLSNLSAFADKSFDNFEVNDPTHSREARLSLEQAVVMVRNFADHPSGWLVIQGTYGCGKTHLAAAAGNVRLAQGDSVIFITVPDLLDHLRASYGPHSEVGYDETFERLRTTAFLILDDLGVENPSPWAQEKLFQLLNYRYIAQMPTIITTNSDIDDLDPRIRSRLLDNKLIRPVKIHAPDYRTHLAEDNVAIQSRLDRYPDMHFNTFDIRTNTTVEEHKNLEKALNVAAMFAERPGGILLIMGLSGVGKTHLAAAIGNYWREQGERPLFIEGMIFLDELRSSYDPSSRKNFNKRFQSVLETDLLIFDDLEAKNNSTWANEKLFQLIDHRYVSRMPTVITTHNDINDFDMRLQTRLVDPRRSTRFAIMSRPYPKRLVGQG